MRLAILAGLLVFLGLFALTIVLPDPAARAEAARYFSTEEIEHGLQRSFEGKLLFLSSTLVHVGVLALLALTVLGQRLREILDRWTGCHRPLTLVLLATFLFLGSVALSFPFALASLEWQRAWGLTHRSIADWLVDYAKGVVLSAVSGAVVVFGLYLLLRFFPRFWWALAAAGATLLGIGVAFIMPIWISPLFNTFTPLDQTPWKDLRGPVRELAERAGVPVQDVLVMDASRQGEHTNAYFTGFGATRRVVLYDTLLKSHTKQEVLSILAHEFGHWQHNHIAKGIALGCAGGVLGLFLLSRFLRWAVGRHPWNLRTPADPAGLPLILILGVLGNWCALPVVNAISREFERQADQASLELEDHADVFIEAEKRLARDNISNVAPNWLSVWLFATHPPAVKRIEMAEEWKKNDKGTR